LHGWSITESVVAILKETFRYTGHFSLIQVKRRFNFSKGEV
jgi:hypothetical protein